MRILIVGGTGLIGGHAALALRERGHEVTLAARKPAAPGSPMAAFPTVSGDYIEGTFQRETIAKFDALLFAAGNDPRHLRGRSDEDVHWQRVNSECVPRFFALARDAGIERAVNIGSFYPQAAPHLTERSAYVRSRKDVDERVRALNSASFQVCCVNPPFVVGVPPGDPKPKVFNYVRYALGLLEGTPVFAIPGGVNFMSVHSLSDAIAGAFERGEPGKSYLVGDENLTFQAYLTEYFRAVGRGDVPPVRDADHPLMPPSIGGPGTELFFEPPPADVAMLGYRRADIRRTVEEIVSLYWARRLTAASP
ncbi:NAD-dependent epimerase/dehydratase family protein [Steroidobacter sp.]|uniref:NAD-dependent epimerase/dehydratase family protein n=1 Tax=Steroidobacter sp. TaxID=1978227 RepID=UPI001A554422|nr:NAD-dependent epimerase/dehydratase family protein [Steroidobacter sp.]MBL8267113.1 NAD-dependent epimerase/dehydratase family protein [Steroidobacter sp.]